jgi:hypothetical protein
MVRVARMRGSPFIATTKADTTPAREIAVVT